jgi:tetratricopeptide (TPR) repeat protein
MVLVTTRIRDTKTWGSGVKIRELHALDDIVAAQVLTDLAPNVPDRGASDARELARRLGGLPLALHLAGNYLASPFARWRTFADYRRALDGIEFPEAIADADGANPSARGTIRRTWDLSLEALAADGQPKAKILLTLLSCYAPATAIPSEILDPALMGGLFDPDYPHSSLGIGESEVRQIVRDGVTALAKVGLVDAAANSTSAGAPTLTVHPVVADSARNQLTRDSSDVSHVGGIAVALIRSLAESLDPHSPSDWPKWQKVTPHVVALLQWVGGRLDVDALAQLLEVTVLTASAQRHSGAPRTAERLAELGIFATATLDQDDPATLATRNALGQAVAAQGRNIEAERIYRQVLAGRQRVLGDTHEDTLKTRQDLAEITEFQGRTTEAEQLYRCLLDDALHVLGSDAKLTLTAREHLAWLTALLGNNAESEAQMRELLQDRQRLNGNDHPYTLSARSGLAWVASRGGKYQDAEKQLRDVLADQRCLLGEDHPSVADTRFRLGRVLAELERYKEAEGLCREALASRRRVQGDDHPVTLSAQDNIARIRALRGYPAEAERIFRSVLADRERVLGHNHPHTLTSRHRLAWVIATQGRRQEGEQTLRQVLRDRERILGQEHPGTLSTLYRLAEVIAAQGRPAEAAQLLRQVVARRAQVLGQDHPETILARTRLAGVAKSRLIKR